MTTLDALFRRVIRSVVFMSSDGNDVDMSETAYSDKEKERERMSESMYATLVNYIGDYFQEKRIGNTSMMTYY